MESQTLRMKNVTLRPVWLACAASALATSVFPVPVRRHVFTSSRLQANRSAP